MPSSSRIWISRWLAVLSLCLFCSTLASAQSTGGRILGRVADPTGAVLANVKVTLTHESTGTSSTTNTNDNGDYSFPQVSVGVYRMEFDLAGFKKNLQKSVNVDLNQVVTINSVLQIGEAKETVEVTSEAPLVDTTSTLRSGTQLIAPLLPVHTSTEEKQSSPIFRVCFRKCGGLTTSSADRSKLLKRAESR